jgi:hypothetical protein
MKSKKYIQKYYPSLKTAWSNSTKDQLRELCNEYYKKHVSGERIVNKDRGFPIIFTNKPGGRKLSFGGAMYHLKAESVKIITDLLTYAEYNNFGSPKATDKSYVVGYLNFKAKGIIDEQKYSFRISVQLRKDGFLYYNHEINIKKEKA